MIVCSVPRELLRPENADPCEFSFSSAVDEEPLCDWQCGSCLLTSSSSCNGIPVCGFCFNVALETPGESRHVSAAHLLLNLLGLKRKKRSVDRMTQGKQGEAARYCTAVGRVAC